MKKMIKLTLASAISVLILAGCGVGGTKAPNESMSGGYELMLKEHTKTEAVHHAIMKAGTEMGLKMTEFKSNAIIAEKIGDDSASASATVTFSNDKIVVMQESGDIDADDLLEAVQEELEKEDSH